MAFKHASDKDSTVSTTYAYPENMGILSMHEVSTTKKSWRAPLTMGVALLAGLGFSLAHHFMNQSLNGTPVTEVSISQTWVSRFGTALAFLVKMCFTVAVGVAYVQHQWWKSHRRAFSVRELDALTTVLSNVFSFVTSCVWLSSPLLTIVALISWTLPFAAVVTPGTLTVAAMENSNVTQVQVLQPNFTTSQFLSGTGPTGGMVGSPQLDRLLFSAAAAAQPPTLHAKYQNESYSLQFYGPGLRCSPANDTLLNAATTTYGRDLNNMRGGNLESWSYISCVGGEEKVLSNSSLLAGQTQTTLDTTSTDALRLFVMTNSGVGIGTLNSTGNTTVLSSRKTYVNLTECLLYNVTYSVGFEFRFPNQTISTSVVEYHQPLIGAELISTLPQNQNPTSDQLPPLNYAAMMEAFGKLFVGDKSVYGTISNVRQTRYQLTSVDWDRQEAVQAGLEGLFQNFTVSLLSDPDFLLNSTQAQFLPVNITNYVNTYIYNSEDLFLAYGIGFVCALACSLLGLHAFFANDASYQNMFSTFIRAANDPALHSLIREDDAGADPLPKHLANVRLVMGEGG